MYKVETTFKIYRETRLIRTPRGHAIVSVLSECPYQAGSQRKRHEHMFYRYKDQSRQFYEKTLFNFLTVTVTSSSWRNLTIIYHSLRVKSFKYCSTVIETGTTVDSFEKVCDFTLRAMTATKSQGSETCVTGGRKLYWRTIRSIRVKHPKKDRLFKIKYATLLCYWFF